MIHTLSYGLGRRWGGACTEVVKPFKCVLDASANFLLEPVPMGDWIRQCNVHLWKYHELPLSFVLTFYSFSKDKITDERVCALVRELQVNQSHQKLEWVQPFMSKVLTGVCWDCYTGFLMGGGGWNFSPRNLEIEYGYYCFVTGIKQKSCLRLHQKQSERV